jgi:16S rRNA (cytidine1402-2'-O)-methyltransferase
MRTGTLIVCANHIGNILDVPPRTIEKIRQTKHIFCDHFSEFNRDILIPFGIDKKDKVIFETGSVEDDVEVLSQALSILKNGEDLVFLSDNGMIGFADRGTRIIDMIHKNKILVEVIPGPSIISSAVAVAGIASSASDVLFMSFFDYNKDQKIQKLQNVKNLDAVIVILDFPENMKSLFEIIGKSIGMQRVSALCINIGMESQKIIRKKVFLFNQDLPELKDCSVTLVLEGSVSRNLDDLVGSTGLEPVTDGL